MDLSVGSKPCIACAEIILSAAKMCKYCKTLQSDPLYLDNLSSLENRMGANSAPVEIDEVRINAAGEGGSPSFHAKKTQQGVGPKGHFFEGEKSSPKNGLLVSVGLGLAILLSMAIVLPSSTPESANPQVDRWADVDWGSTQGGTAQNADSAQTTENAAVPATDEPSRGGESEIGDSTEETGAVPIMTIWDPTAENQRICSLRDADPNVCPFDGGKVAVSQSNTYGHSSKQIIQRLVDAGICEAPSRENSAGKDVWYCIGGGGSIAAFTIDSDIWSAVLYDRNVPTHVAGDGWLVSSAYSSAMKDVAALLGGNLWIDDSW